MATFGEKLNKGWNKLTGRAPVSISLSDKPFPFHVEIVRDVFVRIKIESLYKRILRDCIKRSIWSVESTEAKDNIERSFYDCFENSENNCGLVSYIAKAMYDMNEKVLVWKDGVLREATKQESKEIKEDYKTVAKSSQGIIINFKNYELTKILKHYYCMLYAVNMARNTAVNVAASLKIQIDKLREMVGNDDADAVIRQAQEIADALKAGKSVLLDSKDIVATLSSIDTGPLTVTEDGINSEIAQETGLPEAYISARATTGASVIGDADINRESEGIEPYYKSIWKPIIVNLYGIQDVQYRSDRWRAMESKVRAVAGIETLDTLTPEEKREYAVRILEIENVDKKDPDKK